MRQEASDIYLAESTRVKGETEKTLREARANATLTWPEITELSQQDLENKMRRWRIWVVTLGQAAQNSRDGDEAAQYLKEAKGIMVNYYEHPLVILAALEMKQDRDGHEYQMRAEMARDKGSYYRKAANLTGSVYFNFYLSRALGEYSAAIFLADEGTSAKSLAFMEQMITGRELGQQIDFPTFTRTYQTVVGLSSNAGGWDRQAAVSWWYIKEAFRIRRFEAVSSGLKNLKEATKNMGVDWKRKYLLKDIVGCSLEASRRATFSGDPYQFNISTF